MAATTHRRRRTGSVLVSAMFTRVRPDRSPLQDRALRRRVLPTAVAFSSRSIGSDERRPASSNLARLALRRSTTSSIDVTTTGSTATSASVPPVAATTRGNRGEPRIDEAVLDPSQLWHTDTASGAQLLQREPSGPASLPKRGTGSYEQVIHVLYPITQTPFAL